MALYRDALRNSYASFRLPRIFGVLFAKLRINQPIRFADFWI